MIKIKHILLAGLYIGLTLLLTGCKFALLDPKGIIAAQEKHILIISALLMLIVVIPVMILSLLFSWQYRKGNAKAKYSPEWAHSTVLEVVWWSFPCIIVVILAAITWVSSHQLDPYKTLTINDKKPIKIQAIALEWKWLFIYPEQNIATVNFIQIPIDTPITFLITSEGPMNSLQIPQLAGQIYAMAGMQTKLNLAADHAGDYQGFSANFSGEGFSDMKFNVRASTLEQFNQWVKSAQQSRHSLTMDAYKELVRPSINHTVSYFSPVNQSLFDTVIMKSMMPMPTNDMNHPS